MVGRRSRHGRRLRRRLRHYHLWRVPVVHEREHHPDRLSNRGGRVWSCLTLGAGDPVLRRRIVRRNFAYAIRGTLGAASGVWRGCGRAGGDYRLHSAPPFICRRSRRNEQFRDGSHEHCSLSGRRAAGEPYFCDRGAEPHRVKPRVGPEARAPSGRAGPWATHLRRAMLLGRIWTGFLGGAFLSGAATPRYGAWVLAAPALILAVLAAFDGP